MSSINVGVGVSKDNNLIEAAKKAAQQAKEELGNKKPKLLMFFCTYTYPEDQYQRAQQEVYNIFEDKEIPLVGGTTLGFFAKDKYYFDISLFGKSMGTALKMMGRIFKPLRLTGACVVALQSDFLQVSVGLGQNAFKSPRLAGENAIKEAVSRLIYNPQTTNSFLITPGSDKTNKFFDSEILEGMISAFKGSFRVQGGGLCGGVLEKIIYTGPAFYNGGVYEESVIAVLLDSKLLIGYGVATGAEIVDKIGLVSKLRDNWTVEEINGKPAVDVVYKVLKKHLNISKEKFVGNPLVAGLCGFNLVSSDLREDFFWPNFITEVIDKKCIKLMNSDVKEETFLALSKGTKDSCTEAAVRATKSMVEEVDSKNFGFVMFFSCALRGVIMGRDYFDEVKQIKKALGDENVPVFGICSYGEQAFYRKSFPKATLFTIATMGISNKVSK